MELKRKNNGNRQSKVMYFGEGAPYSGGNAGGAVQVNLCDVLPGTGLEGVYTPANWSAAFNAFRNEVTGAFNALSSTVRKAFKTARNWFKSFFGL